MRISGGIKKVLLVSLFFGIVVSQEKGHVEDYADNDLTHGGINSKYIYTDMFWPSQEAIPITHSEEKQIPQKVIPQQVVPVHSEEKQVALPSRGGEPVGKEMIVEATAYCLYGNMANGNYVHSGAIAVDPRVIPLGTKVFVEGYGYATAEDTGSAIKGNIIDVWFPTEGKALNWGRRKVKMWIITN